MRPNLENGLMVAITKIELFYHFHSPKLELTIDTGLILVRFSVAMLQGQERRRHNTIDS